MKVRRDIASVPQRSAKATWERIIALISTDASNDVGQLRAASSVMEALIAEEHPAHVPILVKGCGPRLVIYLKYDRDALEHGDEVEPLSWNPTEGDWAITAPTAAEDVSWMNNVLSKRAPRISVHDVAQEPHEAREEVGSTAALKIDWGAVGQ